MDEADKAPLEVVALLKGLLEDGFMRLGDGRVLRRIEVRRFVFCGDRDLEEEEARKCSTHNMITMVPSSTRNNIASCVVMTLLNDFYLSIYI